MKKFISMWLVAVIITTTIVPVQPAYAAPGLFGLFGSAVVRAIKAIDLKIQRQQNKVIWLQNAQKTIENTLSKLKLREIADWTEKQKQQYAVYYEELHKVKSVISYYQRIREIMQKQVRMVQEYNRVWGLLNQDDNFTLSEVAYMGQVYTGILEESLKNINQITMVVQSFTTTMSDAKRLEIINAAAEKVDENYNDLRAFNQQNTLLSLQRSKTLAEKDQVKRLYGLE
ncbi:conjugal transfer protein TraI [Flavobacterium cerinum]|uniref:Conjugal transfer protein TraI n=1 Tax=Flavobacterium cerinum TaxID=2502784 RepID=A0ABY5IN71_9FLAO|nr:conjugal transfer protein TraI [Flavobacterium cerinum]UUC44199.1 conjugal transfer protein TraI [Flavobacterium cerinum]